VEDIETSYYPTGNMYGYKYNSGILANPPLNALSRFRQYVDVVNRGYMGTTGPKYASLKEITALWKLGLFGTRFLSKKLSRGSTVGKPYEDYPYHMHRGPGLDAIRSTVEEALLSSKSSRKCWTNGTQENDQVGQKDNITKGVWH
jgi:hypothetical protein